jgi:2-pyrone-4,6-dicarboxylate lactonase
LPPREPAPACAAPLAKVSSPAMRVPSTACDSHHHVFGPSARFPFAEPRSYTPPDCSFEQREALHAALGVGRSVIVQPSVYGSDNRAMLAAMARSTPGRIRGIAVVDPDISDAALDQLHRAGVRGVRVNILFKGGTRAEDARAIAERIKPWGWHVQFLVDVSTFAGLASFLGSFPVDVVVDHMGHFDAGKGTADPGFRTLLGLLDTGRCWVKLSAPYRLSRAPFPYADVTPIAEALVRANPERLVWGSDWPHPGISVPMPDDGAMLDLLGEWIPDAATRDAILRDNPAALYDFPNH